MLRAVTLGWAIRFGIFDNPQPLLFRQSTTASLFDVVRMASLTPAERAGIGYRTGSIEVGKQADLLVLLQNLEIQRVFIRGREVSGGLQR